MTDKRNIKRGGALVLPLFVLMIMMTGFGVRAVGTDDEVRRTADSEGRPIVFVKVGDDGKSFPFLLDTGASRTVIYRVLVAELQLAAEPFQSRQVYTATGRREMSVYRLGRVEALGRSFLIKETVALPDPRTRGLFGLVGVDLLRGRLLLRQTEGSVKLLDSAGELNGDDWASVPGRPVGYGSVAIEVIIDGNKLPAIVDTGASVTVLNPSAALMLEESARTVIPSETARVTANGTGVSGTHVPVETMEIGDKTVKPTSLITAALPVFSVFGAKDTPAVILGMDVLGRFEFALDFRGWSLWLRDRPG